MPTRTWIQDNHIDLSRYSEDVWTAMPTIITGENVTYTYFESQTPVFSSFAITALEKSLMSQISAKSENTAAIPVMTINTYKRRFDISFLRKHFIILRASTRHIIRKINYERRYYSRGLGLKQNKRPGIAENTAEKYLLPVKEHFAETNVTAPDIESIEETSIEEPLIEETSIEEPLIEKTLIEEPLIEKH